MSEIQPFHLAIPVHDLDSCEAFYVENFGCEIGRRDAGHWVDLNFYGHQLVLHVDETAKEAIRAHNQVDDHAVPIPHFGVVLTLDVWRELADRLQSKQIDFIIEPYIRFEGTKGEQATMFLKDLSGNALEFKAFADQSLLFEPFEEQMD